MKSASAWKDKLKRMACVGRHWKPVRKSDRRRAWLVDDKPREFRKLEEQYRRAAE